MRRQGEELLHNNSFGVWPRGDGPFTADGAHTAMRYAMQRINGGAGSPAFSVAKALNPTSTGTPKWRRGRPYAQITVTSLPLNSTALFRQYLEMGDRVGQGNVVVRVWASGPSGASFYFGLESDYHKAVTLGNTTAGEPIVACYQKTFTLDDTPNEFLRVTPWSQPSDLGVFGLYLVSSTFVRPDEMPGEPILRTDDEEWQLARRFYTPIKDGLIGYAASSSTLVFTVQGPPGGWRIMPALVNALATPRIANPRSGTSQVGVGSSWAITTSSGNSNADAVRITCSGFSGLTQDLPYALFGNGGVVALLDADYV